MRKTGSTQGFQEINISEYDFSQCVGHWHQWTGYHATYLISFWEQRIDPTDGEDEQDGELYWHEIGYVLRGATSVTEAIRWQEENAKNRPAATFLLIRYEPEASIGDISSKNTPGSPQKHQALLLHGIVPKGKILDDSNFFEINMTMTTE